MGGWGGNGSVSAAASIAAAQPAATQLIPVVRWGGSGGVGGGMVTSLQQQAQPQHTWFKTEGRISMAAERLRAWLCLLACLLVLRQDGCSFCFLDALDACFPFWMRRSLYMMLFDAFFTFWMLLIFYMMLFDAFFSF